MPHYSTDWAAAGPLLEEMASGPDATVDLERLSSGMAHAGVHGPGWVCSAFDWEKTDDLWAFGVTGPEAIARAYVAWKAAQQ